MFFGPVCIEYKFHFIYSHESVIHQETAGCRGHIFILLFIWWRNKCNNGFKKSVCCLKKKEIIFMVWPTFFCNIWDSAFSGMDVQTTSTAWVDVLETKVPLLLILDAGVLLRCEKPADSLCAIDPCLRASGTVPVPTIAWGCASAVFLFSDVFNKSCQRLNEADYFKLEKSEPVKGIVWSLELLSTWFALEWRQSIK